MARELISSYSHVSLLWAQEHPKANLSCACNALEFVYAPRFGIPKDQSISIVKNLISVEADHHLCKTHHADLFEELLLLLPGPYIEEWADIMDISQLYMAEPRF